MDSAGMYAPLSPEEAPTTDAPKPRATDAWTPILPVPKDAPTLDWKIADRFAPKGHKAVFGWGYKNARHQLLGWTIRFESTTDASVKQIRPFTYCNNPNGKAEWRPKSFPAPRPLFGLPTLARKRDAAVLVVEGEKAAHLAADGKRDAGTALKDYTLVTSPGGAEAAAKADWSPLAGRRVIVWPDNDEPGRRYAEAVAQLATMAGASVSIVAVPDTFPMSWDLGDDLPPDISAEDLTRLVETAEPWSEPAENAKTAADEEPEGYVWPFRLAWNGVEKRVERVDRETGITTVEWRWFCSVVEIAAETRSADGEEWGRLLIVTDRDSRTKPWAMPMAMLAGDGTAYRERLLSLGLIMAPGKFARDALHEYISTARPDTKARCVGRVGWHTRAFTLSNQTVEHGNG